MKKECVLYRFICVNGYCINFEWKCDGDDDCGDFLDEIDCFLVVCFLGKVKCGDFNVCIDLLWLCDWDYDCENKWDESEEVCNNNICEVDSFCCILGYCIFMCWYCDGEDDCGDGSDEGVCGVGN